MDIIEAKRRFVMPQISPDCAGCSAVAMGRYCAIAGIENSKGVRPTRESLYRAFSNDHLTRKLPPNCPNGFADLATPPAA